MSGYKQTGWGKDFGTSWEGGSDDIQNLLLPFPAVLDMIPRILPMVSYPLQQRPQDLGADPARCPAA